MLAAMCQVSLYIYMHTYTYLYIAVSISIYIERIYTYICIYIYILYELMSAMYRHVYILACVACTVYSDINI